jgi:hypothetical protein
MPVVTHGRIGIVPIRLTTHLSLNAVLEKMRKRRPNGQLLKPGWGSLGDDVSLLGRSGAPSPSAGKPVLTRADDRQLPSRIEARAYWWEVDRDVLGYVGAQERRSAMRLMASDIFISRVSRSELLVLVSTRNQSQIREHLKPLLDDIVEGVRSDSGTVELDSSSMDLIDPNFFLWLIYKSQRSPAIDNDLTIADMGAAHSVDGMTRATQVSRGIDMDRGEVLALIMQPTIRFGPVKVVLSDAGHGVDIDCEIAYRGEFSIYKKDTGFFEPPEEVSEEYRNVLYVLLFAHDIYPRLVEAWKADGAWHSSGEADFRAACRALMLAALR